MDLEHTWLSGLPIHFGVIYLGYLVALWAWRRRARLVDASPKEAAPLGTSALVFGLGIVVVAGGLSSLAIGEFPGFTWFLVRLLITVPFLLVWWGLFGTDIVSGVVGGVVLAFVWATYSQFLGPVGLPDTPLRLLDPAPPPVSVRWLDYRELWLISLPIYLVVMLGALVLRARGSAGRGGRALVVAALVPLVLGTTAFTIDPQDYGVTASFSAAGSVELEGVGDGTGQIHISATDMGNRVTPLPPHDRLAIDARVVAGGKTYEVTVRQPMVEDPLGRETTWWGVAFGVDYVEPGEDAVRADLVAYGLGDVVVDGQVLAHGAWVEVIAARDGEYPLRLEAGSGSIPLRSDLPELVSTWSSYQGSAPEAASLARYLGGGLVLLVLLVLGLLLVTRMDRRGAGAA